MKRVWNEFLTFLALTFLFAFSYPAFVDSVSPAMNNSLSVIQWICWIAFAADLVFGFIKAESKVTYLKRHPLEIASTLLPFLRPLRLMRVISFGGFVVCKDVSR